MLPCYRWYACLLILVVGCQEAPKRAFNPPAVQVRLASWDDTEKLIASHRGKVVVVDAWSTWCAPCMTEFPGLVKLHQAHPGQVACISLNCNYTGSPDEPPDAERPQIEAFLVEQRAEFDNLICTESDEKLFQILDAGAIPVVRVYDRSGKLRQQFDNDDNEYGDKGFSYEQHIAPLVAQLLRE